MKLPKNRDTVYLVVRQQAQLEETVPIACFRTPERADEYAGACSQDFDDHNIKTFEFNVQAVIYYDE